METLVNRLKETVSKLKEVNTGMSLNQKVLFGGAGLLIIILLIILLAGKGGGTAYETLYSELDEKDAAAIVEKLKEEKIDYKLEDNGTTILVPLDYKYSTRLKLASENLPRGEVGFELFRESNFGETQTDKKVKYQEALQGELARTIQRLDKVKAAKVNLALPEPSLFSNNEEAPKASVVINTRDGENLSPKEVQGIINLVSNSVERLEPENIVIVDQNGKLISNNLPSETGSNTDIIQMQMAIKKKYETEKEEAIQSMLDKTLGKDNSVVRVNVELNFDNREQKDEHYTHDPEGPFIRSEQIIKESGTERQNNQPGIPGTDNNIPQYEEVNTEGGQSSWDKSDTTRNYEIDKTETVTRFSPGNVKYDYLTVAVLVNNTASRQANLGETEEEKAEKIRSIVATACGLRENRNDENVRLDENISVAFMDFYAEPEPEPEPTGAIDKLLKSPFTPWAITAIALAVIILSWLLLRRKGALPVQDEAQSSFETVIDDEINIEDLIDKELTPEERERQKIRQEIDKLIDENPEDAAQVIRAWLMEE